ncbi:MAG: YerC/YecD family TrpR-related protein, partial [Ruminococcus sp.]
MNNKIKDEATDLLFKAILSLKNEEECYSFFEDLCTVPELKAMSQRIVVAKMLTDKKVYSDIVAK